MTTTHTRLGNRPPNRLVKSMLAVATTALLTVSAVTFGADAASATIPNENIISAGRLNLGDYADPQIAANYNALIGNLEANAASPSWDGGLQTQNGGTGFLTVDLTASDAQGGEHSVTLFFHPGNLYLAGIQRPRDQYPYFFNDDSGAYFSTVNLGMGGHYNALTQVANRGRSNMPISWFDINGSVLQLATEPMNPSTGPVSSRQATARSLLLLIQMFSESTRFPAIQRHFSNALYDDTYTRGLTPGEEHLENNWSTISSYSYAVHHGQSPAAITITGSNYSTYARIDSANAVRRYVRILLGSTSGHSGFDPGRDEV
jgi:hypothetical protein